MADVSFRITADDLASGTMLGVAVALGGMQAAGEGVGRSFEMLGNIITGIKSAFDLIVGAFQNVAEFSQQFVDAAADAEVALVSLDTVLGSTAPSLGSFGETIGGLSDKELLKLYNQLENATASLKNMKEEFPPLKQRTDLQTLAFKAQQDEVIRLTNAIKGGSESYTVYTTHTQLSRDALIELSKALQLTTIYSDEQVQSAEAMILRYENINADIFPTAIQLTTDLAASLGLDLTAAARMVGMALDDPAAGIGRLNTQFRVFDESEMSTIKHMAEMGDVAGAQALIIQGLTEKFGGAAVAIGETFTGKLAIAKNMIDEWREAIGAPFIEIFKIFADKFMEFGQSPFIQTILDFFGKWTELLKNGVDPLLALGMTFQKFADVAPIFQDIGDILVMFNNALTNGIPLWDAFGLAIDTFLWAHPESPLAGVLKGIQDFIATGQSEGWGTAIAEVLAGALSSAGVVISGFVNKVVGWIAGADWTPVTAKLIEIFTIVIQGLANGLGKIIEDTDWASAGAALKGAFKEIMEGAFGDDSAATTAFQTLEDKIDAWWKKIWAPDPNTTADIEYTYKSYGTTGIESFFAGLGTGITTGLKTFVKWMSDGIINYFKLDMGISSPSTVFAGFGRDIMQGLINGINGMFDTVLATINRIVGLLLAPFKPILDLLGIDISGLTGGASAAGLGTASGGVAGTSTTELTGTQSYYNYYYGPVYFQGTGQTNGGVDCQFPNPILNATAGGGVAPATPI